MPNNKEVKFYNLIGWTYEDQNLTSFAHRAFNLLNPLAGVFTS